MPTEGASPGLSISHTLVMTLTTSVTLRVVILEFTDFQPSFYVVTVTLLFSPLFKSLKPSAIYLSFRGFYIISLLDFF